ncbi:hypothetical protein [Arcobacter sp.]|uniref:hypothetical protein n=1 Tax=Arcobacter sp. TaxID=1872629 RepID=UPI003D0DF425
MKKVIKVFLYLLFFCLFLIAFLPKENFYFLFEHSLKKKEIVISQELTNDKMAYLKITNGNIIYQNRPYAKFQSANILSLLVFSSVSVDDISFLDNKNEKYEKLIEKLSIKHTLINPLHMIIKANGAMGELKGNISLLEKKITLELEASRLLRSDFNHLLKNWKLIKGKYYYEYQF